MNEPTENHFYPKIQNRALAMMAGLTLLTSLVAVKGRAGNESSLWLQNPTAWQPATQSAVTAPRSILSESDLAGLLPFQQQLLKQLARDWDADHLPVSVCFAPDTPPEVIAQFYAANRGSPDLDFFRLGSRWTTTATNGGGLQQGDPTTLTWSVVPDGTVFTQGGGIPTETGNSNVIAFFNGIYGNQATWLPHFRQVFDRWHQLTAITYVEMATDDGASLPTNPGVLGVRGDLRISGRFLDGPSNVLAYNYFPNTGDMVIDTGDTFYNNTGSGSIRLRNVASHEHGHGLAFQHVCPTSQTKLMEPFVSIAYDGPQHDDILSGQRGYGDRFETNDTAATFTNLGTPPNGTTTTSDVSVDDNADADFYRFTVPANKRITIVVRPVGLTYLEGPQNGDGTCPAGTNFNSLAINDLGFELRNTDGTSILASVNVNPAGQSETLSNFNLPSAGNFFIRVFGGAVDSVQLYSLDITLADTVPTPFFIATGVNTIADNTGNGNSNGMMDPGETSINLTIQAQNIGSVGATGVSGTLTSLSGTVSITTGVRSYPDMAASATGSNTSPFVISVSPSHVCGTPVLLRLTMSSAQGGNFFDPTFPTGTNGAPVTVAYSGAAVAILDPGTINLSLPVSGLGRIADLNFRIDGTVCTATQDATTVGITHSWVGDLVFNLISPLTTNVRMMTSPGGGNNAGNNFCNTVLDDDSGSPSINSTTTGGAPFTGSFSPENPLSGFDGQDPNGTWTFRVQDTFSGDGGFVRAFSLVITPVVCLPPIVPGAALGQVPDVSPVAGVPFTVRKNSTIPTNLDMSWGAACGVATTDYSIHEGTIGTWYSHTSKLCTTSGGLSATITPGASSRYYLIVPRDATAEGSYGTATGGAQRPRSTATCLAGVGALTCP